MAAPPPNYVFSLFSFVGLTFVTVPMYWHLEAWNTGTCLYMAWTGVQCLNLFVNSVVWNGNAINWSPVWCDISTRIFLGANVAIPAASLCINRRLYHIACVKSVMRTKADKQRAIMVDLAIGLGIPLLEMILSYIVQGHRFNIFEDIGCYPFTYNVPAAYPLVFTWPLAISVISAVYCGLTIRSFAKRRSDFNELLSSNRNLTVGRYFRLMCLAGIELVCGIPLSSFSLYLNITAGIQPWISWENVHVDFSRVEQIPSIIWKSNDLLVTSLELSRWLTVLCAFIFFAFFGFADEARKHYRSAYYTVAKTIGFTVSGSGSGMTGSSGYKGSRPYYPPMSNPGRGVTVPGLTTKTKRDSNLSFSDDRLSTSIYIGDLSTFDEKTDQAFSPTETTSPSSSSSASLPSPDEENARHRDLLEPPALTPPQRALSISSARPCSTDPYECEPNAEGLRRGSVESV